MKTRISSLIGLFLGIWLTFSAAVSFAQTRPEYIPLGGGVKGVLASSGRNHHSSYIQLPATCRLDAAVAKRIIGSVHEFPARQQ
jgi:hypothetical protein